MTKKIIKIKNIKKRLSYLLLLVSLFSTITCVNLFASRLTFEQLSNGAQISIEEFEKTIEEFVSTYPKNKDENENLVISYPAVKKIISPTSRVAIHADFHGDKNAMFNYINELAKDGHINKNNKFKILNKNFYMVFTGDFSDRGPDGLETLYIAMRLRIENPDNVEILRGNHEDLDLNKSGENNFFNELKRKKIITGTKIDETEEINEKFFDNEDDEYDTNEEDSKEPQNIIDIDIEFEDLIMPIYNVMPIVLYLGVKTKNFTNYAMFMHAGIEPRFNPNKLLESKKTTKYEYISELDMNWIKDEELKSTIKKYGSNKTFESGLPEKISNNELLDSKNIGFLWSDFIVEKNKNAEISERLNHADSDSAVILSYGENITKQYLNLCSKKDKYSVNTIIRGHQHFGDLLRLMIKHNGIYGLWLENDKQWNEKQESFLEIPKYSVWTLLTSPKTFTDTDIEITFDTYAILHFDKNINNWKLYPAKINM